MSTFDDNERSTSSNRPIELYTIVTPTATYRHTSSTASLVFSAHLYTPLTMDRDTLQLGQDSSTDELVITLPITHPLVQRFCATGIPEQVITVTVHRMQTASAQTFQQWTGFAQSISISGHLAKIRVPANSADALKTQLPVLTAQRACNHRLFDSGCSRNPGGIWPPSTGTAGSGGPDPATFTVSTTVASVSADGLSITLTGDGGNPDGWAQFGRLIMSNGETRRVLTHIGNVMTVAVPFGAPTGSVQLEAGCDHTIATCVSKFNNVLNFGGHPDMSPLNLWTPSGLGVIQQV